MSAIAAKLAKGGIPFSKAFQPGGYDDRPIQTLASPQTELSRKGKIAALRQGNLGVQTYGLPTDNKTTLGAYRMGDSDTSSGAIYPNTTHAPLPPIERQYPQVAMANVANNVYQPEDNGAATHALLKKYGDQKFKAKETEEVSNYLAQQRLVREIQQVERTAGLNELNVSREIVRNMVEQRRRQNEDDYLRRLLDAGMSAEDAKDEIDQVRRANALQEAKKPEGDRLYQSKILLTRLAAKRGIVSNINEPLNSSGAIMNPQPSAMIAQAQGAVENGFGQAPLDLNRQFLTPEFYRRYLRRSNLTQESADREAALNELIKDGEISADGQPGASTQTGVSIAYLKGLERERAIEMEREAAAARLQALRMRGQRIYGLKPEYVFATTILEELFRNKPSDRVLYITKPVFDLSLPEAIIAINQLANLAPENVDAIKRKLTLLVRGLRDTSFAPSLDQLREMLYEITPMPHLIQQPTYDGKVTKIDPKRLRREIDIFVNSSEQELQIIKDNAREIGGELPQLDEVLLEDLPEAELAGDQDIEAVNARLVAATRAAKLRRRNTTRSRRRGGAGAVVDAAAERVMDTLETAASRIQALARGRRARREAEIARAARGGGAAGGDDGGAAAAGGGVAPPAKKNFAKSAAAADVRNHLQALITALGQGEIKKNKEANLAEIARLQALY